MFCRVGRTLLDGQGRISIRYEIPIMLDGGYLEQGVVDLNEATLIIEGAVIPEPITLSLLTLGMLRLRKRCRRYH